MKNCLVISSSPRLGSNSALLCQQLIKGANEAGHQTSLILLKEKKILPCVACDGCRKTHQCVLQDDMEEILTQMLKADVLVLASPVYFYSINSLMKTLIDRCFSKYQMMKDKELIFILTAADDVSKIKRALDPLQGFTDCLDHAKVKAIVYGDQSGAKESIRSHVAYQYAYEIGKAL